ncbi:D-Ala-D-Ala carboxypeptidase family metallohydrolase [Methylobacterium trifolii]|uniref:Peptidase M15A C-terminal domain-containing protein n=1 Tax=Methylobacterium trifolii TaxID=1003092 RepID=A0ABQ4U891_9HYPH|nr:D-Ala-D-Ala carboxypeptidase family metallohydrolase [Methylobacterium trifolii]GJE62045.1 hypothetical protein MPOCJGCO_4174 [Methylobacterium trifolii]
MADESRTDLDSVAEATADVAEDEAMRTYDASSPPLASDDPPDAGYEEKFKSYLSSLNLRHFGFREFLFLGGSHYSPTSACRGRNALPPEGLWNNIGPTARVLDELRERLGAPIRLNSIYRNTAYNSCLSGAAAESQHKSMRAVDFTAADGKGPAHWHAVLRRMRDMENVFSGGLGIYNTFVHVDTRGTRADWDNRT